MLEVRGLEAAYGDVPALSGVTLRVGAGEIVALLGPNGAGKSTLLGCVAGLVRPRAGAISWDSENLLAIAPHRIVEHGLEDGNRTDRRDERDDEQHSEYPGIALVFSHSLTSSDLPRPGTRVDAATL